MPAKDTDEIKAMIQAGQISAITLDTSVFDQFDCNLTYKSLTALGQFKGTPIQVLLTAVTVREVTAHIAKSIREASQKLTIALNGFHKTLRLPMDKTALDGQFGLNRDPAKLAETMVAAYIKEIGAIVLNPDTGVSPNQLLDLYFEEAAPFSAKDGKKSEFPDAMALLSLEHWGRHNGMILAISRDDDWMRFAETSDHIVCVTGLPQALGLFNDHPEIVATRIVNDLREGRSPRLRASIESVLERYVEDFDIEANSSHYYEAEADGATILDWHIDAADINVLDSDDDTITLSAELTVDIEFRVQFRFSHWDNVDREYIRFPSLAASTSKSADVQLVMTLSREGKYNPDLYDLAVETSSYTVDFGNIEPDWN